MSECTTSINACGRLTDTDLYNFTARSSFKRTVLSFVFAFNCGHRFGLCVSDHLTDVQCAREAKRTPILAIFVCACDLRRSIYVVETILWWLLDSNFPFKLNMHLNQPHAYGIEHSAHVAGRNSRTLTVFKLVMDECVLRPINWVLRSESFTGGAEGASFHIFEIVISIKFVLFRLPWVLQMTSDLQSTDWKHMCVSDLRSNNIQHERNFMIALRFNAINFQVKNERRFSDIAVIRWRTPEDSVLIHKIPFFSIVFADKLHLMHHCDMKIIFSSETLWLFIDGTAAPAGMALKSASTVETGTGR